MADNWKNILDKAKKETEEQLFIDIKKHTTMTDDEINEIAPTDVDKQKLKELLDTINDATKSNDEKKEIVKSIVDASDVVFSVFKKIF